MAEEQIKGIIRIAGKDMPGKKHLVNALCGIRGVGIRFARNVAYRAEKEAGIPYDAIVGTLTKEQIEKIEAILKNARLHGLPAWSLN